MLTMPLLVLLYSHHPDEHLNQSEIKNHVVQRKILNKMLKNFFLEANIAMTDAKNVWLIAKLHV